MGKRTGRTARSAEEIEFNRKLGERMEMLRVKARVSQMEMAQALGIQPMRLYWYEAGRSAVPPVILVKFAAQIGVSIDEICKQKVIKCGVRLQIQKSLIAS